MTGYFAADLPANGVCCGDRMQYTHVPNLARTELTDENGTTLFSALRHGVLDAYDISASTLRKLPERELFATVMELLFPYAARKAASEGLDPYSMMASADIGFDELKSHYVDIADLDGEASKADSAGKAANANPTVQLTYGDDDYATIQRASPEPELFPEETPPEVPPRSEGAWESTLFLEALERPYWKSTFELDMSLLDEDAATPSENLVSDGSDLRFGLINQQVSRVVGEIRTDRALAAKYASAMRTAASANMARELAVTALIGDPGKFQAALDGEVVDLNLSSISL